MCEPHNAYVQTRNRSKSSESTGCVLGLWGSDSLKISGGDIHLLAVCPSLSTEKQQQVSIIMLKILSFIHCNHPPNDLPWSINSSNNHNDTAPSGFMQILLWVVSVQVTLLLVSTYCYKKNRLVDSSVCLSEWTIPKRRRTIEENKKSTDKSSHISKSLNLFLDQVCP